MLPSSQLHLTGTCMRVTKHFSITASWILFKVSSIKTYDDGDTLVKISHPYYVIIENYNVLFGIMQRARLTLTGHVIEHKTTTLTGNEARKVTKDSLVSGHISLAVPEVPHVRLDNVIKINSPAQELTLGNIVHHLPPKVQLHIRKKGNFLQQTKTQTLVSMKNLVMLFSIICQKINNITMHELQYTFYGLFSPPILHQLCKYLPPKTILSLSRKELEYIVKCINDNKTLLVSYTDVLGEYTHHASIHSFIPCIESFVNMYKMCKSTLFTLPESYIPQDGIDNHIWKRITLDNEEKEYVMFARDFQLASRLSSIVKSCKINLYAVAGQFTSIDWLVQLGSCIVIVPSLREYHRLQPTCPLQLVTISQWLADGCVHDDDQQHITLLFLHAHAYGLYSLVNGIERMNNDYEEILLVGNPYIQIGSCNVWDRGLPFRDLWFAQSCQDNITRTFPFTRLWNFSYGPCDEFEARDVIKMKQMDTINMPIKYISNNTSSIKKLPLLHLYGTGNSTSFSKLSSVFDVKSSTQYMCGRILLFRDTGEIRLANKYCYPKTLFTSNDALSLMQCIHHVNASSNNTLRLDHLQLLVCLETSDYATDHRICCGSDEKHFASLQVHNVINISDGIPVQVLARYSHAPIARRATLHLHKDISTLSDVKYALGLVSDYVVIQWHSEPSLLTKHNRPPKTYLSHLIAQDHDLVLQAKDVLEMKPNIMHKDCKELQTCVGMVDCSTEPISNTDDPTQYTCWQLTQEVTYYLNNRLDAPDVISLEPLPPASITPALPSSCTSDVPCFAEIGHEIVGSLSKYQINSCLNDRLMALLGIVPIGQISDKIDPQEAQRHLTYYPKRDKMLQNIQGVLQTEIASSEQMERLSCMMLAMCVKDTSRESWFIEAETALWKYRTKSVPVDDHIDKIRQFLQKIQSLSHYGDDVELICMLKMIQKDIFLQ